MRLDGFTNQNVFEAANDLFAQLGIKLNTNTRQSLDAKNILKDKFKNRSPFVNIKELYFMGLIDDSVFNHREADGLSYDEATKTADENYNGLMLFAIELNETPNRGEISELTRVFNQVSKKMPVGLLLKYGNKISIALSERFKYLQEWRQGEKVGKIIILRDINTENPHAGHLRILQDLAKHNARNFNDLNDVWKKVLDIKTLNDDFYYRLAGKYSKNGDLIVEGWYQKAFTDLKLDLTNASKILGKDIKNELHPQAVIRIIIRMMFMWFMKEKELIKDKFFTREIAQEYLQNENTYYNAILQNLFFAVLNKKIDERGFRKQDNTNRYDPDKNDYGIFDVLRFKDYFKAGKSDEFLKLTATIPFVNGGLFMCHDYKFSGKDTIANEKNKNKNYTIDGFSDNKKDMAKISDKVMFSLIDLFNSYVWTIEESTPEEQDIALDPELLGTVFENIIGAYNPESKENARKSSGSFYTPKPIVDYMCRESFREALKVRFPNLSADIDSLLDNNEDKLDFPDKNNLIAAITSLKILDPACGSGAFPMGMFNLMVRTVEKLQEHKTTYKNKLDIIKNCIYGVDIQNIAIEISKLRFFISLLVDYESPKNIANFDVLPNLETKFVVANTLVGIDKGKQNDIFGVQDAFEELTKIFMPFTTARTPKDKENIKNAFEKKKHEIVINPNFKFATDTKDKIERWNPFNVCYCSPFFDSSIMFGISDGFDIVIGNPPYGANTGVNDKEYFKKNYQSAKTISGVQKGSFDTYTLFIEKGFNCLKVNGNLTYIVPISITSSDSITGIHNLLEKNCSLIQVSSYAVRPQPVFENAVVNTSILFFKKDDRPNERILTTKMYRKNKDFNLQTLVNNLQFIDTKNVKLIGRYPKISLPIELSILKNIHSQKTKIGNLLKDDGKPIYYRTTGGRYFKVITNNSTGSTKEKPIYFDKKIADAIGSIMSSNLYFWWYQIYSNNLDLKSYEIETFGIPFEKLTDGKIVEIEKIYSDYLIDIEKNANVRITTEKSSYKVSEFKEYKIGKSKHLIDKIDDLICPLYGLTLEETEFIKNYEIEFRVSDEE